jgi:hypothetical protein
LLDIARINVINVYVSEKNEQKVSTEFPIMEHKEMNRKKKNEIK